MNKSTPKQQFKVVDIGTNMDDFEREVNIYLDRGYSLWGDPVIKKGICIQCLVTTVEQESEDGSFIKAEEFEGIWIAEEVNGIYAASDSLRDNDYIDYYIWKDQNSNEMYKKHLPNTTVFRGSNPNIIFHGGCLGCASQRNHGIDRCKGCKYFRLNNSKPNLHIEGEEAATMNGDNFKKFF